MTLEDVLDRLAGYEDKGAMFVCEGDGGVRGFAALEPEPREEGAAFMGVWLLLPARGKGIGRWLALMAVDFARAAGYTKVRGTLPAGSSTPEITTDAVVSRVVSWIGESQRSASAMTRSSRARSSRTRSRVSGCRSSAYIIVPIRWNVVSAPATINSRRKLMISSSVS